MRTFFGKPLRDVSQECNPHRITLDEFKQEVQAAIEPFCANMVSLKNTEPQYIEEWYETFLAWSEVEQDPTVESKAAEE